MSLLCTIIHVKFGEDILSSVCVAAVCFISLMPANEQLRGEKRACTKFQNYISEADGQVRIYIDGQIDEHG